MPLVMKSSECAIHFSETPPQKQILEAVKQGFDAFDIETTGGRNVSKDFYFWIETDTTLKGFLKARLSCGNFHIVEVFVAKPFRKLGIATELIQKAIQKASNEGSAFVSIKTSNEAAKRLYEKLGFQLHNSLSGYHHNLTFYTLIFPLK